LRILCRNLIGIIMRYCRGLLYRTLCINFNVFAPPQTNTFQDKIGWVSLACHTTTYVCTHCQASREDKKLWQRLALWLEVHVAITTFWQALCHIHHISISSVRIYTSRRRVSAGMSFGSIHMSPIATAVPTMPPEVCSLRKVCSNG